jgi:hypothetical protein
MTSSADKRRMRGFEPASGLVREPVRKAGESRGFTLVRLLTHWPEVVGAEIAAMTRPVKIGYGKSGLGATLTLLTTGPAAPLVQMQLERIRERVNACYGYNAISRLLITQTAPSGFAEGQASFGPAPSTPSPAPDPAIVKCAEAAVSAISDPDLRAALAMLGQNVLSRPARAPENTPGATDIQKG